MSTIDEETMQDVAEVSSGLSRRQNIDKCIHVVQNM